MILREGRGRQGIPYCLLITRLHKWVWLDFSKSVEIISLSLGLRVGELCNLASLVAENV